METYQHTQVLYMATLSFLSIISIITIMVLYKICLYIYLRSIPHHVSDDYKLRWGVKLIKLKKKTFLWYILSKIYRYSIPFPNHLVVLDRESSHLLHDRTYMRYFRKHLWIAAKSPELESILIAIFLVTIIEFIVSTIVYYIDGFNFMNYYLYMQVLLSSSIILCSYYLTERSFKKQPFFRAFQ